MGVKKTEKSVREKAFPPVKKPEKTSKLVFTGTFYFHGEKKNTAPPPLKGAWGEGVMLGVVLVVRSRGSKNATRNLHFFC